MRISQSENRDPSPINCHVANIAHAHAPRMPGGMLESGVLCSLRSESCVDARTARAVSGPLPKKDRNIQSTFTDRMGNSETGTFICA